MFSKWMVLFSNKHLVIDMSSNENVYRKCAICCKHFIDENFGNSNRLKNGVLLPLNLPDMLWHLNVNKQLLHILRTVPDNCNFYSFIFIIFSVKHYLQYLYAKFCNKMHVI